MLGSVVSMEMASLEHGQYFGQVFLAIEFWFYGRHCQCYFAEVPVDSSRYGCVVASASLSILSLDEIHASVVHKAV
jgi:hypothetical protein